MISEIETINPLAAFMPPETTGKMIGWSVGKFTSFGEMNQNNRQIGKCIEIF